MTTLATVPVAQFNKQLAGEFKREHGYRNLRADFETLPPLGDFVENSKLDIPVLISCEKKIDGKWLKLRAIFLHTRGVSPRVEFKRDGIKEEFLSAFKYCEEQTKIEDMDELNVAERTLKDSMD